MGLHLPFFFCLEEFRHGCRKGRRRRRKIVDRLPDLADRAAGAAAAARGRHPRAGGSWPTTGISPKCCRACRIPMARPRPAPSCTWRAASAAARSMRITLADSGAFVGCAGLNVTDRGLELGYWIGEPYWKCGYATEAAHALVDLAFRATDVTVLQRLVPGHQPGVAAGHPQVRLPVCRAGHAELDRRRPGAGRALPARPQDLGEPEVVGALC